MKLPSPPRGEAAIAKRAVPGRDGAVRGRAEPGAEQVPAVGSLRRANAAEASRFEDGRTDIADDSRLVIREAAYYEEV